MERGTRQDWCGDVLHNRELDDLRLREMMAAIDRRRAGIQSGVTASTVTRCGRPKP
jgi:hypothetical protein